MTPVVAVLALALTGAWIAFRLGTLRGLAQWYFDDDAPVPARALPFLLLMGALLTLAALATVLAINSTVAALRVLLDLVALGLGLAFFLAGIGLVTYLPPWLKPRWLLDQEQMHWRGGPQPSTAETPRWRSDPVTDTDREPVTDAPAGSEVAAPAVSETEAVPEADTQARSDTAVVSEVVKTPAVPATEPAPDAGIHAVRDTAVVSQVADSPADPATGSVPEAEAAEAPRPIWETQPVPRSATDRSPRAD